jgi:membrane dipeptidase
MSENNQIHPYQLLDIDERVKRVLLNTPLADGHNDLPQQPRCCFQGKIHNNPKFDLEKGFQRGMTDLPRLKKGAVGLQFWSICVPHLRGSEDFALPAYNDMCRDAIEQIDLSIWTRKCQRTISARKNCLLNWSGRSSSSRKLH